MKNFFILSFFIILFMPKVTLIPIGGTGLRFEDLLALLILIILFSECIINKKFRVNLFIGLYLLFILFNLISALLNSLDERVSYLQSFLYSIRLLEYLTLYYLGVKLYKFNVNLTPLLKLYVVFVVSIYFLQLTGLWGSFNSFSTGRFSGNTNGPYEMAIISSFIFFYFAKYNEKFYAFVALLILMATASRVTIVITLVILAAPYLFGHIKTIKKNTLAISTLCCLIVPACVMLASLSSNFLILDRFADTFSGDTFKSLQEIYISADSVNSQEEYLLETYGDRMIEIVSMDGDASSLIRFHRWFTLVKSVLSTPFSTFFGLGPSFAGRAVDGYYTRVFTEVGSIGLMLFITFLIYTYRAHRVKILKIILLVMSASAIFIDVFVAFKPIVMFWILFGYFQFQQLPQKNQSSQT